MHKLSRYHLYNQLNRATILRGGLRDVEDIHHDVVKVFCFLARVSDIVLPLSFVSHEASCGIEFRSIYRLAKRGKAKSQMYLAVIVSVVYGNGKSLSVPLLDRFQSTIRQSQHHQTLQGKGGLGLVRGPRQKKTYATVQPRGTLLSLSMTMRATPYEKAYVGPAMNLSMTSRLKALDSSSSVPHGAV